MRSARLLSLLGLVLVPSLASAQEKNPFTDSWFWGAKGGVAVLHTSVARTQAPVMGADWLITRSWYGLYLGLDQAYFDAVSTVIDPLTGVVDPTTLIPPTPTGNGGIRRVDIRDMRRFTTAMYLFPRVWFQSIRPYFGLGYAFNFVVRANSQGDQFPNSLARDTVLARIQDAKTRSAMVGTFGIQVDWKRFAPFVQATAMPTKGSGRFLINGDGFSYYVEAGLRYNFGSAIEKLK